MYISMTKLETAIEELKVLPPEKLEVAVNYIHTLKGPSYEARMAALDAAAGLLSDEEADEMARVIEEGCERIDLSEW